jgi:hypothetical protein
MEQSLSTVVEKGEISASVGDILEVSVNEVSGIVM